MTHMKKLVAISMNNTIGIFVALYKLIVRFSIQNKKMFFWNAANKFLIVGGYCSE